MSRSTIAADEFVAEVELDLGAGVIRARVINADFRGELDFTVDCVAALQSTFEAKIDAWRAARRIRDRSLTDDEVVEAAARRQAEWDREFTVPAHARVIGMTPAAIAIGSDLPVAELLTGATKRGAYLLRGGSLAHPPHDWMAWRLPKNDTAIDTCVERLIGTRRRGGAGRSWIDRAAFGGACPYYAARVGVVRAVETSARILRHYLHLRARAEATGRLNRTDFDDVSRLGAMATEAAAAIREFVDLAGRVERMGTLVGVEAGLPEPGTVDRARLAIQAAREAGGDLVGALDLVADISPAIANAIDPSKTAQKVAEQAFILSLAKTFHLLTGVKASPGDQFVQFLEDAADAVGWPVDVGWSKKSTAASPWRSIIVETLKRAK